MNQEDKKISISPNGLAIGIIVFISIAFITILVSEPSGWGSYFVFITAVPVGVFLLVVGTIIYLARRNEKAKNSFPESITEKQATVENVKKVFILLAIIATAFFLITVILENIF